MKTFLRNVLLAASGFALLDQISKYLVNHNLQESQPIIANFLTLEHSQNYGIAFGLEVPSIIIIVATFILIPIIIYHAASDLKRDSILLQISLALIVGGALGNLIDRFTQGYVTDFISILSWPNFNLADSFISIGVLLIVAFYGKIKRV